MQKFRDFFSVNYHHFLCVLRIIVMNDSFFSRVKNTPNLLWKEFKEYSYAGALRAETYPHGQ
jgi:hypothetical protein